MKILSNIHRSRVELSLFLILLTVGVPMVLLIPPGAGYDEEDHLVRVWEMSFFSFIPGQIPPQAMQYPKVFRDFAYRHQAGGMIDSDYWQNYSGVSLYERGSVSREINTKSVYSPALLLPQAMVLRYVGRPADLPALTIFYLCRFAGLISYLVLIWFAIRLIPFGKWILLVLALSPIAMFQATTISADAISNGLGFLFIAGCLNVAESKEINWKECGALVFLVFLLFLAKLNLVPLILLPFLLLLPSKFTNKGIYFFFLAMVFVLFVIEVAAWNRIASLQLDPVLANEANVTEQILYIFGHPFRFLQIIITDFITNGWAYFQGWINGYGYYYWTPPAIVSLFYLLSLGSVLFVDSAAHFVEKRFQFAFILTFIASYFATILSLYLTFTPVGADEILGVQGRYFVPLVLLLFFLLSGVSGLKKFTVPSSKWTVGFLALALCLNILGIALAFYVSCGTTYYQTGLCYEPFHKDFPAEARLSPPISDDMEVTQETQITCNGLTELRVLLKPSLKETQGSTRFIFQDPLTGDNLFDESVSNDQIIKEDWYNLSFDPVWDSAGKQYHLIILGTNTPPGQGFQLLYTPQPEFDLGTLYENGQPLEENIALQYGCVTGLRKIWLTRKP
ncbi:MAG TPA: DUF2142 domain-containing protein [Anaerolineales bacterium]|nr:DUF2142 domain-containing protein [Anaerolineales bacterium]